MRQEQMLYDGAIRTIVLSEQGSNSRDHSAQAYRDQAAGLVYTWLKLDRLPSIESYIHHRWMDHASEGGLDLGVRRGKHADTAAAREATATVCCELTAHGVTCTPDATSKPAWDVFRVPEISEQANLVDWTRTYIPAHCWEGV